MLNVSLVRALLILCFILVTTLMVSAIDSDGTLLAFGGWRMKSGPGSSEPVATRTRSRKIDQLGARPRWPGGSVSGARPDDVEDLYRFVWTKPNMPHLDGPGVRTALSTKF